MASSRPGTPPQAAERADRAVAAWRLLFLSAVLGVLVGSVIDTGPSALQDVDDKLQHLFAFALLAVLASGGFPQLPLWRTLVPALLAYGLAIECLQSVLPWREFSLLDLAADAAGVVPGAFAAQAWRGRRWRGREDAA